ncbi:MAG: ORF6C domain-containing protein [Chloroflexi bacterium]|nr:ORF6C domain-containing protein [Chloroflexota bacterium]MCI0580057.1 ORF6C domain-containing protein [Chloroflexota bacterium]MCI0649637.1 ORF6C domain-containing protein [Chloroflexota bacterium]MCI0730355.1 ORF6C domain-containing protein [Chloroflexota bacterium]
MAEESKALVPVEQKVVEFYDDKLTAVRVDVEGRSVIYVPVRPICDYLGVSWSGQRQRMNRDPVLSEELTPCVVVTHTQGQPDQRREMLCLPLDVVNGWLFGINANRVREELRRRLIQYQKECYRVLADAFVNRPAPDDWMQTSPEAMAALQQIRENALAVARLAEEQMQMMSRLDKAAVIIGQHGKRITALEAQLSPREAITDEQAADISAKVLAIATEMTELDPSKNHYQGIFAELHRRFRVTSYKNIRQSQYQAVLDFLDTWAAAAGRGKK